MQDSKVLADFPSDICLGEPHVIAPISEVASQFHSQNLDRHNTSTDSERMQNLYLLLIKFRLEELGFRRSEYTKHLDKVTSGKLTLNQVQEHVATICQWIIAARAERGDVREETLRPRSSRSLRHSTSRQSVRPKAARESLFICPVCCEEVFVQGLTERMPCRHHFCDNCLSNHIEECINQAKFDMACLEIECDGHIPDEIIKRALPAERYDRFRHFKRKREMEANPNNKYCSKPNCDGVLKEQDDENVDTCPICYTRYCRFCNRPTHIGNCEGQLEQAIETVYQRLKIKKCPKCKSPIQKSQGCNHMTCKKCLFEFCWICLRPYSKYHYRYYNCCGCPGMQFEDQTDFAKQRCKQVLFFLVLPIILLGLIAMVILCLPLYMAVMIFIKPYQKAIENAPNGGCCCEECCDDCCGDCCDCQKWGMCCFLLFFVYLPYGILYGVFVAPIKFMGMIYSETLELLD